VRRALFAVSVVIACAPSACGSFLADIGDEQASQGAGDAAANADGTTSGEDSASGDSDGGADVTQVQLGPCGARFCSNFDGDAGPKGEFNWNRLGPSDYKAASTFGPSTKYAMSFPQSLHVETAAGIDTVDEWLEYEFAEAPSGYVAFSLLRDITSQQANLPTIMVMALNCDSGGNAAEIWMDTAGTVSLKKKGASTGISVGAPLDLATWTPIRLDFTRLGTDVSSSLKVGTAATADALTFDSCSGSFKVRLGATTSMAAFDLYFDDAQIDWK
jgi:hypothetical protein